MMRKYLVETASSFALGIFSVALSRVLNERIPINPDLSLRLEMGGVSAAHAWMAIQAA